MNSNVIPTVTVNNVLGVSPIYASHGLDFFISKSVCSKLSHFKNLLFCEFGQITRFSPRTVLGHFPSVIRALGLSRFGAFVFRVVYWFSEKKMARFNARWIVAVMANVKRFIESAKMNFVRYSMRPLSLLIDSGISVAKCVFISDPIPASGWRNFNSFNMRPEPVNFFDSHKQKTARRIGSKVRTLLAATNSTGRECCLFTMFFVATLRPVNFLTKGA